MGRHPRKDWRLSGWLANIACLTAEAPLPRSHLPLSRAPSGILRGQGDVTLGMAARIDPELPFPERQLVPGPEQATVHSAVGPALKVDSALVDSDHFFNDELRPEASRSMIAAGNARTRLGWIAVTLHDHFFAPSVFMPNRRSCLRSLFLPAGLGTLCRAWESTFRSGPPKRPFAYPALRGLHKVSLAVDWINWKITTG